MNETPRIVSAAVLMDDGLIVPGVRHYSPDMRAILARIYGNGFRAFGRWIIKPYHLRVKAQGFIDASGQFLDREDAWMIADAHGQIFDFSPVPGERLRPRPAGEGSRFTLFSENLY